MAAMMLGGFALIVEVLWFTGAPASGSERDSRAAAGVRAGSLGQGERVILPGWRVRGRLRAPGPMESTQPQHHHHPPDGEVEDLSVSLAKNRSS